MLAGEFSQLRLRDRVGALEAHHEIGVRLGRQARLHLTLWAGIEFDPQVVAAFLSLEGLPELRSHARAPREEEEAPKEADAAPAEESYQPETVTENF